MLKRLLISTLAVLVAWIAPYEYGRLLQHAGLLIRATDKAAIWGAGFVTLVVTLGLLIAISMGVWAWFR